MKDNQGSVIFVMFAAIALAAILSLTVMTRNQEYSMDAEEVSLVTSQALQIMSRTRESLQRFLLTKDLTLEQIDMHDPFFVAFSDTDSCTADSCNLYSYSGGSASPPVLPPTVLSDLDISGCTSADDDGTLPHHLISSIEGVGSDLPEVLLYYCGISLPVCQRINIMHGVRGEGDAPVVTTYGSTATNDYQYFADNHTNPMAVTTINQLSSGDSRIVGHQVFCSEREPTTTGKGNYLFYVLVPR